MGLCCSKSEDAHFKGPLRPIEQQEQQPPALLPAPLPAVQKRNSRTRASEAEVAAEAAAALEAELRSRVEEAVEAVIADSEDEDEIHARLAD